MPTFKFHHVIIFFFFLSINTRRSDSSVSVYRCLSADSKHSSRTFQTNLKLLLSSLISKAPSSGFYNDSIGETPNRVYGLAHCRGDVTSEMCLNCLINTTNYVAQHCMDSIQGIVWYDYCLVRYSRREFFSAIDSGQFFRNQNWTRQEYPDVDPRRLIRGLVESGPSRPLMFAMNKFEVKTNYLSGSKTRYGRVECTRDLSSDRCRTCLNEPMKDYKFCCKGMRGWSIVSGSCSIRYDDHPFFFESTNRTSLQMLWQGKEITSGASVLHRILSSVPQPTYVIPTSNGSMTAGGSVPTVVANPITPLAQPPTIYKTSNGSITVGSNPIVPAASPQNSKTTPATTTPTPPVVTPPALPPGKKAHFLLVRIGATILGILIFIAAAALLFFLYRRRLNKKPPNTIAVEIFFRNNGSPGPKRYKYSELKKMTNSFRDNIGQGGYGSVFKGRLPNGQLVAAKVLSESKGNGQEFINEVASIGKTYHVNVVTLLGFCFEGSKRALIYEYMPNGSLDKHIYGQKPRRMDVLGWEKLYQIALDIARGLEYLHVRCSTRILHLDIKPHNILLDENFSPKISDFGLAKLCSTKDSTISTLTPRGTMGYTAPEVHCRNFGGVSYKSDVYSYGMMVLEMVGGRKNIDAEAEMSQIYFPQWVYKSLNQQGNDIRVEGLATGEEEEMARQMILVGLWCIQMSPADRPTMSRVVEMFQGSIEDLPMPPNPFPPLPS